MAVRRLLNQDQPFEKVVCKYNTIFLRVSQDFKKGGIYMEEMIVKNVDVMGDFITAAKFKNKA